MNSILERLIKLNQPVSKFVEDKTHPWVLKLLFGIGSFYVVKQVLSKLPARLYKFNLSERYGAGSWAVVTGGSDGIGKAFCFALAKEGFNIAIVARTISKMDDVCFEIQKMYQVQTKIIQANFKDGDNVEFFQQIFEQVKNFDVSILINNVGYGEIVGAFQELDTTEVMQQLTINTPSTLFMTKILFDKLMNRPKKSAVISISSILSEYPMPYSTIYNCTKAFQDYFTQSLIVEYGHQIDFMTVKPSGVSTNMINNVKGSNIITAEEFVQASLDELRSGKHETYGHTKHKQYVRKNFQGGQKQAETNQIALGRYMRSLKPQ